MNKNHLNMDLAQLMNISRPVLFLTMAVLALIAAALLFTDINSISANLIAAIAIFAGFLINAIILMFNLIEKINSKTSDEYYNYVIAFTETAITAFYISLICVIFLLISPIFSIHIKLFQLELNLKYAMEFISNFFTLLFFYVLIGSIRNLRQIFLYNMRLKN